MARTFLRNWLANEVNDKITDTQKTTVNSTTPYITYVIHAGVSVRECWIVRVPANDAYRQTAEARHRYSEFESLRSSLVKLYPTLIIPPIPSKQSISDYATKPAKAKEDAGMIARRKRMLQTFLNRIGRHPILSNEHVFHRFLDGEVSWVRFTCELHPPSSSSHKRVRLRSYILHPCRSYQRMF